MNVFFRKGLKLIGSTLRSRTPETKARILTALERELWGKFSSGEIKSILHRTLPMARAGEAHAILAAQENLGKVVLTLK